VAVADAYSVVGLKQPREWRWRRRHSQAATGNAAARSKLADQGRGAGGASWQRLAKKGKECRGG
jgi:hypothetical protein